MFGRIVISAVVVVLLHVPSAGLAQDATPIAGGMTFGPQPLIPDPAECHVAPRPLDVFAPYLGTPIAGTPVPSPTRAMEPTPTVGMPTPGLPQADAATVAAVVATLREWVACVNAQDYRRMCALATEASLRRSLATISPSELAALLAPKPPLPAADRLGLARVEGVYPAQEGRVGVLIIEFVVRGRETNSTFSAFRFEDGQYRFDT